MKFLKETTVLNLLDFGLGNGFIDMATQMYITQMYHVDFNKIKTFYDLKDINKKVKIQRKGDHICKPST